MGVCVESLPLDAGCTRSEAGLPIPPSNASACPIGGDLNAMRASWKGNISFALVRIPIAVFSATRSSDVSFKYLHKKDLSKVSYKRFCEAEDKEVPREEITRGYEYEKDRFVEITDEELKQANVELTRTIQIIEFADEKEIDSLYFVKSYYLEPQKGGERAYALMREALARAGKVGVARVVLRSKEFLAAVKPVGKMITMQTMRFAHEIVDTSDLNLPEVKDVSKEGDISGEHSDRGDVRHVRPGVIQRRIPGPATGHHPEEGGRCGARPRGDDTAHSRESRRPDGSAEAKPGEKKKAPRRGVNKKTVATRARAGQTKAKAKAKKK